MKLADGIFISVTVFFLMDNGTNLEKILSKLTNVTAFLKILSLLINCCDGISKNVIYTSFSMGNQGKVLENTVVDGKIILS